MYRIFVDLKESIEDVYPGLHPDEVDVIAQNIHENWDYSSIYDEVIDQIEHAAEEQNKKLDEYAALINRDRKRRGLIGGRYTLGGKPSPTGRRDGGYVTQISAFKEGGIVSKKNLNFLKNFHNTVVEEGRERLEGDDTGPESVTTMRIIGLMADLGDGEKEYLLPSYDPETKEVLDPEGKSKEERNIIYQKIISKFLPAILDGQIEGYSSWQEAEKDRKKIYKSIIGR